MISDETLQRAAAEYEQALLESLPEVGDGDHAFSPAFEKKMRRLCRQAKYARTYSAVKRAACAAIAVLLCGSMLLMGNAEVRALVYGWVQSAYNSYTMFYFSGGADEPSTTRTYEFETVPEGYTFLERMDTADGGSIFYVRDDGMLLVLDYEFSIDGETFLFKAEDHTHIQENVDGIIMDIYIANSETETSAIMWENDEKVMFIISAPCEKDELIEFAKNVRPVE